MSRLHDILMARGRTVQNRAQGRTVLYAAPENLGGAESECTVLFLSAEDGPVETDQGVQNLRTLTVNVQIGTGEGMLEAVHREGKFYIDVDGADPVAWTVRQFGNSDVGAGWARCLCTRPILMSGVAGKPRPRK